MDYFETVKQRRSIRSFTAQLVEAEKLEKILEAANAAPSAGNLQAYEIYAVNAAKTRGALAAATRGQDYIAAAPVVLVFCVHPARAEKYRDRGRKLYSVQDATIACTYAMLAATALGLATVWVGAFNDEAVWKAIGAPEGLTPVAMLPIGYPGEWPEPMSRRPLDSLVHEG
jgi:nitroreductase